MTLTKAIKEFENSEDIHSEIAYKFLNLTLSRNEVMRDEFFKSNFQKIQAAYNFFKNNIANMRKLGDFEEDREDICFINEVKKYIQKKKVAKKIA